MIKNVNESLHRVGIFVQKCIINMWYQWFCYH